jgi:hypothetical protein
MGFNWGIKGLSSGGMTVRKGEDTGSQERKQKTALRGKFYPTVF